MLPQVLQQLFKVAKTLVRDDALLTYLEGQYVWSRNLSKHVSMFGPSFIMISCNSKKGKQRTLSDS